MIGITSFVFLRLVKGALLRKISELFSLRGNRGADLLFRLTYSTQESVHELFLFSWVMRLIDMGSVFLLSAGLLTLLDISTGYILGAFCFTLLAGLLKLHSRVQQNQHRLIEEMSSFVFRYEMALLGGQNQYLAIREAAKSLALFDAKEDVEGYAQELEKLFQASKWMVIKKVIILLERGKHFTGESLSMDFAQVSSELFERYARAKKLELEKRENLILLPMSANMLIMIIYVAVPFLAEFIWR
ncbi:MAG TPA: hypothetical protein GX733_07280 [Tissierellia bacterium]|jgi:hypothetical protein|nr:hypothetical protein [Tissierellia bacterium]